MNIFEDVFMLNFRRLVGFAKGVAWRKPMGLFYVRRVAVVTSVALLVTVGIGFRGAQLLAHSESGDTTYIGDSIFLGLVLWAISLIIVTACRALLRRSAGQLRLPWIVVMIHPGLWMN